MPDSAAESARDDVVQLPGRRLTDLPVTLAGDFDDQHLEICAPLRSAAVLALTIPLSIALCVFTDGRSIKGPQDSAGGGLLGKPAECLIWLDLETAGDPSSALRNAGPCAIPISTGSCVIGLSLIMLAIQLAKWTDKEPVAPSSLANLKTIAGCATAWTLSAAAYTAAGVVRTCQGLASNGSVDAAGCNASLTEHYGRSLFDVAIPAALLLAIALVLATYIRITRLQLIWTIERW